MFQKYPHLERLGTDEVEGILEGKVYVFPKIDGTNASVWMNEDGTIGTGSRRRVVTPEDDNQGFAAYIKKHEPLFQDFLRRYSSWRLFGEWLVPHSLKTYRDDAWRKFYVFDVYDEGLGCFLEPEDYAPILSAFRVDRIPIQAVVTNPTQEWLIKQLEANTYLIRDGEGVGEGIVLKRYDFVNKYGRTTWAKIVRNEFREKHKEEMGVSPVVMYNQEYEMSLMLTEHVIQKVIAELQPWHSKNIPQLLGRVWHEFITEEMWAILKKYKNPTINFKALHRFVIQRIKELSGVF
jgi:hypothetical protein